MICCSECLAKRVKVVELVKDKCPECGTLYALPEVFNVPVKAKPGKRSK